MFPCKLFIFCCLSLFFCINLINAQTTSISGFIYDEADGQGLPGAVIIVTGKVNGTTTDFDGNFALYTNEVPPLELTISFIGYETQTIQIAQSGEAVKVGMKSKPITGREVVVSASRISESLLKSPLSIEKIDLIEIRNSTSTDVFGALANLRGVQANTSSMTFTSVNTRGFADVQNWRFIQLIDGAEMNAPGLNYPLGALSAPSDVDVQSMELVPGAGSALYGANAFNGMLSIHTKNPFFYKGLNAEIKSGMTVQADNKVHPFGEVGLRYAYNYKDKFAFKCSASALFVRDWGANDSSYYISNELAVQDKTLVDSLLALPHDSPNFNAVNVYGDEVAVPIILEGVPTLVNRSGIAEKDIVNYNQQVFKANIALHYRISETLELSYDGRFTHGDGILRHSSIYPLVNLWQQLHKIELSNGQSFFRTYFSQEHSGNSYSMFFTGAYIQEKLKSSAAWAADYAAAYNGDADGVTAQDHQAARAYADRDMPDANSDAFQTYRSETLNNTDLYNGGSKFVDKSSFVHAEGNYDFSRHWDVVNFQLGGSFRRYNLVSGGSLFNDGANGFGKAIGVYEYGFYLQASKDFFKERLHLRASGRVDKNQNYPFRVSPRASVVVAWGRHRNHNFRFTYQNGFRNPAPQEAYSALDIYQSILLGGVRQNIDNYKYELKATNPLTLAETGTFVDGNQIYDNLVSQSSFQDYLQTGDSSRLVYLNLPFLRQEQISTFEAGYRALIAERFFVDANVYYNRYSDFVTRLNAFSIDAFRNYSIYTNISETISSLGAGITLEVRLPKDFKLGFNYAFSSYDAEKAIKNNPNFLPSFNMPMHRFNASFGHRNIWKGLGFNLKYRWSDGYWWQSPFGQGYIRAAHVLDAAVFYRIPSLGMALKLGATNLLRQKYQQVYGGPQIGSQIYLAISYDPLAYSNKNKK